MALAAVAGAEDGAALWRLSVSVEGTTMRFKVPCGDGDSSIGELSREVADRCRRWRDAGEPQVTVERLTDERGALLFPEDRVRDVLENRARVVAHLLDAGAPTYTTAVAVADDDPARAKKKKKRGPVDPPYVRDDAAHEYLSPSSREVLAGERPPLASQRACPVCGKRFALTQQLRFHLTSHRVSAMTARDRAKVEAAIRSIASEPDANGGAASSNPAGGAGVKTRRFFCCAVDCEHNPEADSGAHPFIDFAKLRQHYLRRHTNEKPFSCPRCGRGYAVKADMQTHAKQCGKVFQCSCGESFGTARMQRLHVEEANAGSGGRGARHVAEEPRDVGGVPRIGAQ